MFQKPGLRRAFFMAAVHDMVMRDGSQADKSKSRCPA
jgi:hypothetical protein